MHLSSLILLPLALVPLVTADSDSGEGSWSLRGYKTKADDAKPPKPDQYEDLASGRNVVKCADLSNGEEVRFVKGVPGDFAVTVYQGLVDDTGKNKCLGESATIQPGEVYEGPFKRYEIQFLPIKKRSGKVLGSFVA
ncbi:hypothetical protein P168DRAFT_287861 [Aspergillus campestris IBT 28561]|uniref:Uncharacterized protein n=1 Tax=Aspergillus campestris (strain IBT 28561) TaxID=1392248 RepID=A0A2I1DBW7_ASPC2|nr:uncharacterized protein P168DRAFT_287861 [Aspergillus campestris IBT 28561]PKY07369.1 hypothetical protein P168DRAFT_287861 [Aspergillus campestris IBT 28561]